MFGRIWALIKDTVEGFVADECMSRGAAIAYYTVFSIAPLLVIATAIAGFFFGDEAVHGALDDQLRSLIGAQAAETVQTMVKGASDTGRGAIATIISIVTLLFTASGTFGELQASLNAVWKAEAKTTDTEGTVSRLVRARAASIGLVAATGFILLVSLIASTAISAVADWLGGLLPGTELLLSVLNFAVSLLMITLLFAAIYKVLPDRRMAWRDVLVGALVTAVLFVIGKSLIGWYLGSGAVTTSFGAASALMVLLVWVYYSAQIFLMGAEFTRAYAGLEGSRQDAPIPAKAQAPGTSRGAVSATPAAIAPEPLLPKTSTLWTVAGGALVAMAAVKQLRRGGTVVPALMRRFARQG
ncbi:YihY/virulence factor BrkB family protein [Roseomonas sp. OT10]|uniref:YihY/virulence factor BrkB family protein n=1 Tax=Roseomonas cutis TaxID=2897332 RepID=UPI001E2E18E3|nr:YihY/virulence factor BrkB family protein [Roseomonas sp. OT10]UFN47595.1 YihY/virulence factor BrkB family protein [Roseomonas sp. OT10]